MKIVVDPGHGGSDPGAVGPTKLEEAGVNLSVCNYLCTALEAMKVSTRMTRTANTYIALGERCEVANDWGADYFVSVHCNSDGPSAVGIETLYKTSNGKALAEPIQEALIAATDETNRGLKVRNDLYVLNGTRMPAVLTEIGFISHPKTEAKLKTDEYQSLVATAIAQGIALFLHISISTPKPPMT